MGPLSFPASPLWVIISVCLKALQCVFEKEAKKKKKTEVLNCNRKAMNKLKYETLIMSASVILRLCYSVSFDIQPIMFSNKPPRPSQNGRIKMTSSLRNF